MTNPIVKSTPSNRAAPWLIWGVSVVVYFAFFFRLFRFFSLDFATLITNLYWDWDLVSPLAWYVNPDWIPWGEGLLNFAAAPLIVLFTAALLYRLTGRFTGISVSPGELTGKGKLLLALSVFLPFAAFCLPFALALSVWIAVEAFWWIQWYQNIEPTMEWIRTFAPLLVLPGALLLGFLALRFSLRAPQKPRNRNPYKNILRAVGIALSLPILTVFFAASAAGSLHASRVAAAPGRAIFEARCGTCHSLYLTLYYIKTPVEWRRTIDTQIEVEKVDLNEREKQEVTRFVTGMRSFSDSWTFRTRCQRCHITSYLSWEDRPAEDWQAIVERIARWSPYYYRPDVRDQVVNHLRRTRSRADGTLGLEANTYRAYRQLNRTCGLCHSLSLEADRYRRASAGEITALFARMNRKIAQPLAETELANQADSYRELMADPQRFDRLFPHDRPTTGGGLPW